MACLKYSFTFRSYMSVWLITETCPNLWVSLFRAPCVGVVFISVLLQRISCPALVTFVLCEDRALGSHVNSLYPSQFIRTSRESGHCPGVTVSATPWPPGPPDGKQTTLLPTTKTKGLERMYMCLKYQHERVWAQL